MIRDFLSPQFVMFLATGATAAAINFGSRVLYSRWFGFSTAVILAYATGMVAAFVLAKLFVFHNTRRRLRDAWLIFCAVNLLAIAQTWLISMGMALYLLPAAGVSAFVPELAHAAGIVAPVFSSYLGHKRWSFR